MSTRNLIWLKTLLTFQIMKIVKNMKKYPVEGDYINWIVKALQATLYFLNYAMIRGPKNVWLN